MKSILAPRPCSLLMPTGGVEATRESIEAWFRAGVACVGIGSNLIPKDVLATDDYAGISRKTADVLRWIREVRGA